ncbi:MAG: SAM-dependent methyltransferase [Proteobacteria bacterium]|nr:SAM-dependent methyltransferase [Pseudomonadota bacterium]
MNRKATNPLLIRCFPQTDIAFCKSDQFRRQVFGLAPKKNGDFAWVMHMYTSMKTSTGRMAVVLPHGVLFRDSEAHIREKVIEADYIEAVIGLGPNLFYNSPMEACVVVLRMNKPKERKNKVIFINGVKQVTRERAFSSLSEKNLEKIVGAYFIPKSHEDIARMVDITEIRENLHNLSIPLYVHNGSPEDSQDLTATIEAWQIGRVALKRQTKKLFTALAELGFKP